MKLRIRVNVSDGVMHVYPEWFTSNAGPVTYTILTPITGLYIRTYIEVRSGPLGVH
jgi:hypothetical protein